MFSTPGARILKFLISRALAIEGEEKDEESERGPDRWSRTSMASRGISRITIPPMAIPYFVVDIAWLPIYFYMRARICVCVRVYMLP